VKLLSLRVFNLSGTLQPSQPAERATTALRTTANMAVETAWDCYAEVVKKLAEINAEIQK